MSIQHIRTITTGYGIDYGKALKKDRTRGWFVYSEADGRPAEVGMSGTRYHETEADAEAAAHALQARDDAHAARKTAEAPTKVVEVAEEIIRDAAADLATPRQVDYIMSLIARGAHLEGGYYQGPTTREGVAAMTKASASAYINSLTNRY